MFEGKIEEAVINRFPAQMDKVLLSVQEPDTVRKCFDLTSSLTFLYLNIPRPCK